jgi:hypothetical protein
MSPRLAVLAALTATAIVLVLITWRFIATQPWARYRGFLHRDPGYYSEIVAACEKVLADPPNAIIGDRTLSGDRTIDSIDPSLPPAVAHLHPTLILLNTNRVYLRIGPMTKFGWGINWGQDDMDESLCELSANGDGVRTVLFSRRKKSN